MLEKELLEDGDLEQQLQMLNFQLLENEEAEVHKQMSTNAAGFKVNS